MKTAEIKTQTHFLFAGLIGLTLAIILFPRAAEATHTWAPFNNRVTSFVGVGTCPQQIRANWPVADNNFSYIDQAWRGSYVTWDDIGQIGEDYSGYFQWVYRGWLSGNTKSGCSPPGICGTSNCSTDSYAGNGPDKFPAGQTIFVRAGQSDVNLNFWVLGVELFGTTAYGAEADFGYARVYCDAGQKQGSGSCEDISGTISLDKSSCTAPCIVTADWNTNGLDTSWIYVNGAPSSYGTGSQSETFTLGSPPGTYNFCIKANDGYGTQWPLSGYLDCATVRVDLFVPPPPTVTLTADSTNLTSGQSTTLRWSSTDTTDCFASLGWSGFKALNNTSPGESTGPLTTTTSYRLDCTGPGGSASDSVTVNVSVLNSPPNADAGLPHSLTVGVSHTHTGANASDVDANLSSYSWTWAPSPSACPSSCPPLSLASGVISGTLDSPSGPEYTPNVAGSYTLRLTVFDTVGGPTGTATDDVTETTSGVVTLTVASTNPSSGVVMTISPSDKSGQGNGSTEVTRVYDSDTAVSVTAPSTASGNNFSSWTGCSDVSGTTCSVTMNVSKTVIANYTTAGGGYILTTNSTNPSSGVFMTVSPTDNSGQGNGPTQFTRVYDVGTVVAVTAPSSIPGSNFSNWAGCDSVTGTYTCNVTMNASRTITANYTFTSATTVRLHVRSTNPDSGISMTVSPADNSGQGNGSTEVIRTYNSGLVVTVTAPTTNARGDPFLNWSGDISCSGGQTSATCSVTVNPRWSWFGVFFDRYIYANYQMPPLGVTLTANPDSGPAPLDSSLSALVSGGRDGDQLDYSFWWNCSNTSNNVSTVSSACGNLPVAFAGSCNFNNVGWKCLNVNGIRQDTLPHTYSPVGTYTGKVIVEQVGITAAEARVPITVTAVIAPTPGPAPNPYNMVCEQLTVTWGDVSGETGYRVWRHTT